MCRSRMEIEIKLPFDSVDAARRGLAGLGAAPVHERHLEDNVLFDRPDERLEPAGRTLRLRRAGVRAVLTYKARVAGGGPYKMREEHETGVDDPDAMLRILEGLGFSRSWRYQKYRTQYEIEGLSACLDETPLGCFVELEGPPEAIDRAAATLGYARADYVRESYRDLHRRATLAGTIGAGDLLVEPAPGSKG